MASRPLPIRTLLYLVTAVSCGLFVLAVGGVLWQMQNSQSGLTSFIDKQLKTEREVTRAYAQGLQMGQALRNILLDPQNPQAYSNFERAQSGFDETLVNLGKHGEFLSGGQATYEKIRDIRTRWQPVQTRVIDRVRSGNVSGARATLVEQETPLWREVRALLLDEIAHLEAVTGTIRSKLETDMQQTNLVASSLAIVSLLLIIGSSLWLLHILMRQLGGEPTYAASVANAIADGKLDRNIALRADDNASLLRSISAMQDGLRETLSNITMLTHSVGNSIDGLRDNQQHIAEASEAQTSASASIASAVEELSTSLAEVASYAEQADGLNSGMQEKLRDSFETLSKTNTLMSHFAERMHKSSAIMKELDQSTANISRVVQVIREIAEQTNLLALNAAIEAARAGEQGRGFAVVADEVRKLAERTAQSTHEIGAMIERVQQNAHAAVEGMEDGRKLAEEGSAQSVMASTAMDELGISAQAVRDAVSFINLALAEQRAASGDIALHVEKIARSSEENHRANSDSFEKTRSLQELGRHLEESVSRFRL